MRTAKPLLAALLGCTLLFTACKDSASPSAPAATAKGSEPVSIATIAAEAKGFTVGSEMTVRRVFVFFDAQCPHCAALWAAAKPLRPQARFIWIPVGLLNEASRAQGAALLAAPDPIAAMDQHEASLLAKQGGLTATGEFKEQRSQVAKNTELMNRFGFGSVPTIVANHAQTGELVVKEGSMSTASLAGVLGLQVPAGQ